MWGPSPSPPSCQWDYQWSELCQNIFCDTKDRLWQYVSLTTKKEPLWALRKKTRSIPRKTSLTYTLVDMKRSQLWVRPSAAGSGCSISSLTTQAIHFSRPYLIGGVSSGRRCSVKFMVNHGDGCKAGFWGLTARHAIFRGDWFPFWAQLLGSYWTLVEMEYLTMGYQVTMPELVIKSWVMLETLSHEIKQAQQQSMLRWKW